MNEVPEATIGMRIRSTFDACRKGERRWTSIKKGLEGDDSFLGGLFGKSRGESEEEWKRAGQFATLAFHSKSLSNTRHQSTREKTHTQRNIAGKIRRMTEFVMWSLTKDDKTKGQARRIREV
jgi:hypothetical protein